MSAYRHRAYRCEMCRGWYKEDSHCFLIYDAGDARTRVCKTCYNKATNNIPKSYPEPSDPMPIQATRGIIDCQAVHEENAALKVTVAHLNAFVAYRKSLPQHDRECLESEKAKNADLLQENAALIQALHATVPDPH